MGLGQSVKTHCKHGHPLSGSNLYLRPDERRCCVTCRREQSRRHTQRRREQRRGGVPAARLAVHIMAFVDQIEHIPTQQRFGGFMQLQYLCGVSAATLQRIARGERSGCRVDTADKILTGLGLTHLWQYPPEDGGFFDVWDRQWPEVAA